MPLIGDKYDCGFLDSSGNFVGLMLVQSKDGTPRYMETTDPALASQFFTGLPGYANLEPQKQLQVGQGDWRAGFGQEYFDYADERRYYESTNIDARFKGMVICGPKATSVSVTNSATIPVQCDFNDTHYIAAGTQLYKYTTAGLATVGSAFDAVITDLEPFSDSYLYIALGDSAKFYWMDTAESTTRCTESDGYATFFKRVGDTMWKAIMPNQLKSATDPNANGGDTDWSTATTVDTTYFNITSLVEERGTLYIMKEDMPYYLDASGNPQPLIPVLRAEQSTTSGKNAISWQGKLYIPCGSQTLYEYDNGVATNISPSRYITNNTDYSGQITALAGDAHWLFAVVDNDTKVQVLAGRWEYVDTVRWVWHPIAELTMTGASSAWVTTALNRRLWIGPATGGDDLQYIAIPKNYGDATAAGNYLLESEGEFITPWHHGNFRADDKAWYKLTLTMSGTSSALYWKAYYEILGDTTWTEINSTDKFKVSPVTSAYIPADSGSNKPSSTMIRFKFVPVTTDPDFWILGTSTLGVDTVLAYYSRTPVLINYDVRAVWYPPQGKIILAQVKVSDDLVLLNGQRDETQTAASIRTAIDELTNPTTAWPRAFYPPYWADGDAAKYVKLLPPVDITMVKNEKTKNSEWIYDLTFEVITGVSY